MTSVSASTFARTRSPAAFQAWATEEPTRAADWLRGVARTVAPPLLATIDAFQAAPPTPQGIEQLATLFSGLALGDVQAARAPTLGWVADGVERPPPTLTGTLSVENGEPILTTSAGTFQCVNANFFSREGNDWRNNSVLGGRDVLAFAGRTVTVRGWPDASWVPGGRAKLVVEEFAPGSSPDFISGRVRSEEGQVFINVSPGKRARITDPELSAALRRFERLGVIFPGAPTEHPDGSLTFDGKPDGYYMLAGFWASSTATETLADGRVLLEVQLAHGNLTASRLPRRDFEAGPARGQRHYMFGSIAADGTLDIRHYTPDVGPWLPGSGVEAAPSAAFAAHATLVGEEAAAEPFKPREPSAAERIGYTQDQRWAGYPVGDFTVKRGFGMVYPEHAERLGKPLEDERGDGGDGAVQTFERGRMLWDPRAGVRVEAA